MVNRIDGLRKIATEAGFNPKKMKNGDYMFFINGKKDKIAALVGSPQGTDSEGGVMCYYRLGAGRTVDMTTIRYIPQFFDGKNLNYDKALNKAVEDALQAKQRSGIEVY